jgi:hypothetical protein
LAVILKQYLTRVGATAKARAQQIIGEEIVDRSGALKASNGFEVRVRGGIVFLEFYNDAGEYALFQHEGTGIYGPKKRAIEAAPGKFFAWQDPDTGEWIYARRILGTPAKKFLTRAIDFALEQESRRIK